MNPQRHTATATRAALRGILPAWLALVLLIGGIGAYVHHVAGILHRQSINDDLRTIAQLQAGQIRHWLSEREDEAAMLAHPHFLGALRDWLHDDGLPMPSAQSAQSLAHLADQLRPGMQLHQSRHYRLRSAEDGHLLLALPETGPLPPDRQTARALALEASRRGEVVFDDLHFLADDPARPLHFGLFVPLKDPGQERVMAVLQIILSPEDFLFPLLRAWPTASASGEILLVRRDGNDVLYLNPLQEGRILPMSLRRSLSQDGTLLASQVAYGGGGAYTGKDYRGVACLGYGLPVEGTPWLVVAKMDEAEAWRQFHLVTLFSSLMLFGVLLLVGGWMLGRSRQRMGLQNLLDEVDDLYQNAPCGYHSLDEAGRIVRINDTGLRLLGYTREELLGKPVTDLLLPDRRPGFGQRFQEFMEHQFQTEHLELDLLCKSGERLPVRVASTALRDPAGRFLMTRTLVIDLREQRRLQVEQRLLQQSIEASFDGFVIFAPDDAGHWRFTYCNPAFEHLIGYARSEILGRTPEFLHGREPDQPELAKLFSAISAGERYQGVLRNFRKDGTAFWLQLLLDPIRDEDGQVSHYVGIQRDVTAARVAEEKLQASHEQLRQLSQWHSQAQESERLKIARELHDDLGQRLTLMKMNLSLLQSRYDEIPGLFDQAEDVLKIAQGMTESLRNVVRSLRPTALDMGIVGALEWLVEQHDRLSGAECRCEYAGLRDDPPVTEAVATALFRVAQEALSNASQHGRPQSIRLRLERENTAGREELCLSITDDGMGFDPEQPSPAGHFGLLGMKERALAVGGRLNIESARGGGTRVKMCVPLTSPEG